MGARLNHVATVYDRYVAKTCSSTSLNVQVNRSKFNPHSPTMMPISVMGTTVLVTCRVESCVVSSVVCAVVGVVSAVVGTNSNLPVTSDNLHTHSYCILSI